MFAFFVALAASLTGATLLILLLRRTVANNARRRNRFTVSYLFPVFISALLVAYSVLWVLPLILDTIAIAEGSCPTGEVVPAERLSGNRLVFEGNIYHYSGLNREIVPGRRYLLTYTPRSRFILEVQSIDGTQTAP